MEMQQGHEKVKVQRPVHQDPGVLIRGTCKTLKSGQWEKGGGKGVEAWGWRTVNRLFLEQKVHAGMFHLGGKPCVGEVEGWEPVMWAEGPAVWEARGVTGRWAVTSGSAVKLGELGMAQLSVSEVSWLLSLGPTLKNGCEGQGG